MSALAARLAALVAHRPRLRFFLRWVPLPVRFPDGRRRVVPLRLWALVRIWGRPVLRDESASAAAAYEGGDVVDVGAYHGWYSVLLAGKARPGDRLVSLEPDPEAFDELLANLAAVAALFPQATAWPLPHAVGDGSPVTARRPAGAAGHPAFAPNGGGAGVPSLTVDALVAQEGLRPRFVKVDVEGAEWFVLRGMRRTLAEHRPVVMLELHPRWQPAGVTEGEVAALLEDAGYGCQVLEDTDVAVRQLWRPRG